MPTSTARHGIAPRFSLASQASASRPAIPARA